MKKEIEATFLSVDKNSMRAKLKEMGFELKTPEYLMRRKTFDFPNTSFGQKNKNIDENSQPKKGVGQGS